MLLLGDSCNGKSTSLALLQTSDFNCLVNDFVRIYDNKQKYFNSKINILKQLFNFLKI